MKAHKRSTLISLLTMVPIWTVAIIMTLIMSECTDNSASITPRRTAYPRITLCDTIYTSSELFPINMEINAQAIAMVDSTHRDDTGNQWINISYPTYNATVFCTFTPVNATTINSVIDNRIERISLNVGSSPSEITEINTPYSISARVIRTLEETVTPLQFIASDNNSWVISGAFCFNSSQKLPADSIAPIIEAVNNDIIHAIKQMRNAK